MRVVVRDPQAQAAATEARTQITNFLTAMRSPALNQSNFIIGAEFPSEDVTEFLWVGYLEYREGEFKGLVATPPKRSTNLTNGQPVQVPLSNVTDWAYVEEGKLIGGFSIRLFRSRMSEPQKQSYDAELPYKIE